MQLDIINTGSTAQLVCICGGKVLWRDGFASNVAKAAGNKHFASVALQDGSLHVSSAPLSAAAAAVPAWHLLAVSSLDSHFSVES